eukprot:scaffold9184_cov66-Phaeocystis_antarctica.AAC.9
MRSRGCSSRSTRARPHAPPWAQPALLATAARAHGGGCAPRLNSTSRSGGERVLRPRSCAAASTARVPSNDGAAVGVPSSTSTAASHASSLEECLHLRVNASAGSTAGTLGVPERRAGACPWCSTSQGLGTPTGTGEARGDSGGRETQHAKKSEVPLSRAACGCRSRHANLQRRKPREGRAGGAAA